MRRPDSGRARQVDVARIEGSKEDNLATSSADGDVEPALATDLAERAEIKRHLAVLGIGGERQREEDDVPFVALHVLKVLDEDRFGSRFRQLRPDQRIGAVL